MMIKAGKKILILVVIAAFFYGAYAGIFVFERNTFGIAKDAVNGSTRYLYPGINFVREGFIPGRIKVIRFPVKASQFIDIRVPLPSLQKLESDFYSMGIRLQITYEIIPEKLAIKSDDLIENADMVKNLIAQSLQGYMSKEFAPFLQPYYNREALLRAYGTIIKGAIEGFSSIAMGLGIKIGAIEPAGIIYAPEYRTYLEGIALMEQMRNIENNNKKEMLAIKNRIHRNKLLKDEYLEKLGSISSLIKENPDLLKYIYIDRLGGNVKVIIAPEKSGIPFGLTDDDKSKKIEQGAEIDNLR